MERCPDFARGPPGRGGEGEEGFAFAVSLGMKPNLGRLGISGALLILFASIWKPLARQDLI